MMPSNSLLATPNSSREDKDLLGRSVKKSKFGERDNNMERRDHVPETQDHEMMWGSQAHATVNGEGNSTIDIRAMNRASYRETLTGMGNRAEENNQNGEKISDTYPDSDGDVYDAMMMCMMLMRSMRTRTSLPWR